MPNRKPRTFSNFVTVPLSEDQVARLDALEGSRAAVLRAALDAYLASDTSHQESDTSDGLDALPDGWALASIRDRVAAPKPKRRTVALRGTASLQVPDDAADRLMRGESVPGGPGACADCGHLTLWHREPRSYRSYRGQPCQAAGCPCQGWTSG